MRKWRTDRSVSIFEKKNRKKILLFSYNLFFACFHVVNKAYFHLQMFYLLQVTERALKNRWNRGTLVVTRALSN